MAQPRRLHAAFTGVFTVARHLHRTCTADAIATCQGRKTRNCSKAKSWQSDGQSETKKQNLHK